MAKQFINKKQERAAWLSDWDKKIKDIERIGLGSCTAWQKEIKTHVEGLRELAKKISKTI